MSERKRIKKILHLEIEINEPVDFGANERDDDQLYGCENFCHIAELKAQEAIEIAGSLPEYGSDGEIIGYGNAMLARGSLLSARLASTKRPGFVYFLGSDHGVKIGCTTNLSKRTAQIAAALPFSVELLASHHTETDRYAAEKWFHDRFSSRRLNGEWFKIGLKELNKALEEFLEVDDE